MPSTIGWLAVAVALGALVGLAIGHWSAVSGWVARHLEDPVAAPPAPRRRRGDDDHVGRTP